MRATKVTTKATIESAIDKTTQQLYLVYSYGIKQIKEGTWSEEDYKY